MRDQSGESATRLLVVDPAPQGGVEFVEKLESTRQEMHRFLVARALERLGVLVLVLAGLIVFADWLLELSSLVRGIGLALMAASSLALLYRWAIAPRRHFDRQDAAAEVETTFPSLGQQVRTALEYVEPTVSTAPALPGLVTALTSQTDRRTSSLNLREVIPWRSLRWLGAGVLAILAVYVGLLIAKPELRIAAGRLFLLPVHYTQLTVQPGNQTLKAGEEFLVQVTLTGRPVKKAELQYRIGNAAQEWTRLSFIHDAEVPAGRIAGSLETTLADCQNDFEYQVVAGSVTSPVYQVKVIHPLKLQKLEATVEPPPYTRRKPLL